MKRAVILHGTDGKPDSNWFMWLKGKFEAEGYEVWVPQLPECHTPNIDMYGDFLFRQGWDFTNNILVGHSSGAVEVLNLLMDERLPHVKMAVMAGAWAGEIPSEYQARVEAAGLRREQFLHLFPPNGFDFERMKTMADRIAFIHGSNDPFCPPEQAQYLADQLGASVTFVPNGGHLSAVYSELPEIWQIIEPNI